MPGAGAQAARVTALVLLVAASLGGCSADRSTVGTCPASPPQAPDGARRGEGGAGEVWALGIGPSPVRVGEPLKVVWRVTGDGDLTVTAIDPGGRAEPPLSEPTPHVGSNFARPGEEWGTFFRFGRPGCWTLAARRGQVDGSIRVAVRP